MTPRHVEQVRATGVALLHDAQSVAGMSFGSETRPSAIEVAVLFVVGCPIVVLDSLGVVEFVSIERLAIISPSC